VLRSPILVTLMMEAMHSFETSLHTKATQRNIAEDGILHNQRCENLKYTISVAHLTTGNIEKSVAPDGRFSDVP
jgi:hypothetical protein